MQQIEAAVGERDGPSGGAVAADGLASSASRERTRPTLGCNAAAARPIAPPLMA